LSQSSSEIEPDSRKSALIRKAAITEVGPAPAEDFEATGVVAPVYGCDLSAYQSVLRFVVSPTDALVLHASLMTMSDLKCFKLSDSAW